MLQHTPSTQKPLPHSSVRLHTAPAACFFVHWVPLQKKPLGHCPSLTQGPHVAAVARSVSHPSPGLPLQSPNPAPQVGWQPPAAQVVDPWAFVHFAPQLWQLSVVSRPVSHPFSGWPSQSPNPVPQVGLHAPAVHAVLPCALVHTAPQAPQFAVVARLTVHPSAGLPSQASNPGSQWGTHWPALQLVVPCRLTQATAQVPQ